MVTPDQSLYFSAAEYVKYETLRAVAMYPEASVVVIDGHNVNHMDATVATTLKSLVEDCNLLNKVLLFWNWQPQPEGVAMRYAATTFRPLFKHTPNVDSLLDLINSSPTDAVSIVPNHS